MAKGLIHLGDFEVTLHWRTGKKDKRQTFICEQIVFTLHEDGRLLMKSNLDRQIFDQIPAKYKLWTIEKINIVDKKYLSKTNYDLNELINPILLTL